MRYLIDEVKLSINNRQVHPMILTLTITLSASPGCDTSTKPNSSRSENEEIPFVKPDEELTKRIVDQVG